MSETDGSEEAGGATLVKLKYDNAVLCYLVHKVDLIHQDLLVQITCEFYNDREIENAKELLYKTVASGVRCIKRQGTKKRQQNIVDMLGILNKTSSDALPLFGVFDLTRLPPLDLNNVDITSMTQDIKKLRSDINKSHDTECSAKVLDMSKDIIAMKDTMNSMSEQIADLLKTVCVKQTPKSGNTPITSIWGDVGTPTQLKLPPTITRLTSGSSRKLPSAPPISIHEADSGGARPKEFPPLSRNMTEQIRPEPRDYSRAVTQPPVVTTLQQNQSRNRERSRERSKDKTKPGSPPYTLVGSRRRRPNYIVGKGHGGITRLAGKGRFVSLFVSRLEPDVEQETVKKYVDDKFKVDFVCEKMKTRYDSYASFKIEGYCKDPDVFFEENNWPEDILVRRFYKPRNNQATVNNG
jgi:hypothetical protein